MKIQIFQVTEREIRMVEQLREHPKLMERFEAFLGLTQSEGAVPRADDVEELLIEEVRRLGETTMEEWAATAEAKVAAQFQQEHPKSHYPRALAHELPIGSGLIESGHRLAQAARPPSGSAARDPLQ